MCGIMAGIVDKHIVPERVAGGVLGHLVYSVVHYDVYLFYRGAKAVYPFVRGPDDIVDDSLAPFRLLLAELGQEDLPIVRDQALNERDYGDLSGLNKDDARARSFFERALTRNEGSWKRGEEAIDYGPVSDFLYALDRHTGTVLDRLAVPTAPASGAGGPVAVPMCSRPPMSRRNGGYSSVIRPA